jgi:predicted HicB family RNase H-like nuclease
LQQRQSNHPAERPSERVTTLIPPWLYQRIARDAQQRMVSLSAVVREQLAIRYREQEQAGQQRP